jgi:hypothetical protein
VGASVVQCYWSMSSPPPAEAPSLASVHGITSPDRDRDRSTGAALKPTIGTTEASQMSTNPLHGNPPYDEVDQHQQHQEQPSRESEWPFSFPLPTHPAASPPPQVKSLSHVCDKCYDIKTKCSGGWPCTRWEECVCMCVWIDDILASIIFTLH